MDNSKPQRPAKKEPQELMTRGEFYVELLDHLEKNLAMANDNCMVPVAQKLKTAIMVVKNIYKSKDLINLDGVL